MMNLGQLELLNLEFNNLEIIPSLQNMASLRVLLLSHNRLTVTFFLITLTPRVEWYTKSMSLTVTRRAKF